MSSEYVVVEMHERSKNSGLKYRVGVINSKETQISWGEESSDNSFTGRNPCLSMARINGQLYAIEAHRQARGNMIHLRLGHVDPANKVISFRQQGNNEYIKLTSGNRPRISINNKGHWVEIHEESKGDYLHYSVGYLNKGKMSLVKGADHKLGYKGIYPSIAIPAVANKKTHRLVGMYKQTGSNKLIYLTGIVNMNKGTIKFKSSSFNTGARPDLALAEDAKLMVEIHKHSKDNGMDFTVGKRGSGWGNRRKFDTGTAPAIAVCENFAVVFFEHDSSNMLYYKTGQFDSLYQDIRWSSRVALVTGQCPAVAIAKL